MQYETGKLKPVRLIRHSNQTSNYDWDNAVIYSSPQADPKKKILDRSK